MRLAYFVNEVPYPPRHGGRVDTWSRMQAMQTAGADLFLVTWYAQADDPLPASTLQALAGVSSSQRLFVIRPTWAERWRRLKRLVRWPSHVSSRVPENHALPSFWQAMDAFKPQAVWLDALYGTVLAQACAKRYGIPMFYRSHNIEHRYMAGQVARATHWRDRLAWSMNLPHLKRIEFDTLRAAHTCYDISMDDLQWWQGQGLSHIQWLPPTMPADKAQALSHPWDDNPPQDVAYLGNLRTPNNVEGVLWFIEQVWPLVLASRPQASMLLAGSEPSGSIHAAVARTRGIRLLENAPDAVAVLRSAKVLINPVFGGSGVNIKSVEMLFAPGQRVSTSQGVAGLPAHVQQCFEVHDQAQPFAQAVLAALNGSVDGLPSSTLLAARAEFESTRIAQVLADMQHACTLAPQA